VYERRKRIESGTPQLSEIQEIALVVQQRSAAVAPIDVPITPTNRMTDIGKKK